MGQYRKVTQEMNVVCRLASAYGPIEMPQIRAVEANAPREIGVQCGTPHIQFSCPGSIVALGRWVGVR